MKPLSESLTDLATRVKHIEESSAAMRERNHAALQSRRAELEEAIEREGKELEQTAKEVREATHRWWSDTKGSVERQIEALHADLAHTDKERTERAAQITEDAAMAAVILARYCMDAAEWALVRAGLARGEAEAHVADQESKQQD
ncbi:hypothetical protein [Nocardia mexicana]|uniref:Uncharacterized protein n=1 Tax=Nocardia mexicana TaxID=279262 RepID=A0A370HDA7_9NOCA|nr:hypothetical protein [Nocardia mexicana]RDI55208.1 hypothetical protein DFR68_10140 [Nocardia mexicana]